MPTSAVHLQRQVLVVGVLSEAAGARALFYRVRSPATTTLSIGCQIKQSTPKNAMEAVVGTLGLKTGVGRTALRGTATSPGHGIGAFEVQKSVALAADIQEVASARATPSVTCMLVTSRK